MSLEPTNGDPSSKMPSLHWCTTNFPCSPVDSAMGEHRPDSAMSMASDFALPQPILSPEEAQVDDLGRDLAGVYRPDSMRFESTQAEVSLRCFGRFPGLIKLLC